MFGEYLLRLFGHLLVDSGQECRHGFQHGHVSTQTTPYRAHFQADHARADHTQLGRHLANGQCAVVRQNLFFIELRTRQLTRARARGHDHMLAHQGVRLVTCHGNFVATFCGFHERATTVEERDLVLLKQVQDAVVVLLHDGIFAGNHLGHIHLQAFHGDAVVSEVVGRLVVMFRRLQQGFGRNATHIGTGAAWCRATLGILPFINTRHLETQLGCTDGCDVTARASADHDDIKLLGHFYCSSRGLEPRTPL